MEQKLSDDLSSVRVKVLQDPYNILRVNSERWSEILGDSSLSPRMSAPFLIFHSEQDFVLLLDDADVAGILARYSDIEIERGIRLLEVRSSEGYRAPRSFIRLCQILSDVGFASRHLTAWDADFALVRQDELGAVLKTLSPHIEELC